MQNFIKVSNALGVPALVNVDHIRVVFAAVGGGAVIDYGPGEQDALDVKDSLQTIARKIQIATTGDADE